MDVTVFSKIKEIEIEVVAIRCGCGDPDAHSGRTGGPVSDCPAPLPFDPATDLRTLKAVIQIEE